MTKKLLKLACLITIFLVIEVISNAQNDFTVKSQSTDDCLDLLKPIKSGASISFPVRVTNNLSVYAIVSVNTSVMGSVSNWATVDASNVTIPSGQTRVFNVSIAVPAGTATNNYSFLLALKAVDQNNTNRDFNYRNLTLIVDNGLPVVPTFNTSATSTSVSVYSWNSYDAESISYTSASQSSGIGGIEKYDIALSSKPTQTYNAGAATSYTFSGLSPNTNYQASVTAYDLAGNTRTLELAAITAPAQPTGMSFSNTTYISTTLQWTASAGATGYDVYNAATNAKLNSSPVGTNSYTIDNLSPNTNYTFNIIALSNVGPSDRSSNVTITTIALPPTIGSTLVCYAGETFNVENLISGFSVSWSNSSNLYNTSISGSNATFIANGSGNGWVRAAINSPTGQSISLHEKSVWVGAPQLDQIVGPQWAANAQLPEWYQAAPYSSLACATYNWNVTPYYYTLEAYNQDAYISFPYDGDYYVTLGAQNSCGLANEVQLFVAVGIYQPYIISPNPATEFFTISISDNKNQKLLSSSQTIARLDVSENATYTVKVLNSMGYQVLATKAKGNRITIPLTNMKEGNYVVVVSDGKNSYKKQLVVGR